MGGGGDGVHVQHPDLPPAETADQWQSIRVGFNTDVLDADDAGRTCYEAGAIFTRGTMATCIGASEVDVAACANVARLDDAVSCQLVETAATDDGDAKACTYDADGPEPLVTCALGPPQSRKTGEDGCVDTCHAADILGAEARAFIAGVLMPEAVEYIAGLLLAERVQGPLQLGGDFCAEGVRVTSQPIADTDFYLYVLARPGAVGTCSPDPAATAPADAATCAAVATRSACVSEAGCAYAATSTLAVGRACETDQFGRPISGKPIDVI
jgi:hypothetical protein